LPEKLPAEAGANFTVNEEEPPGGSVRGRVSPDKLKPVPTSMA